MEPSNWWLDLAKQSRQCWESLFIYWTKYQLFSSVRTEAAIIQATLYTLARWAKTTITFGCLRINQKALQLLILFYTSRQLATMQLRLMLLEMTTALVTICRVAPTLLTSLVHFIHYFTQTKLRFEFRKLCIKKTHTFVCKTKRCNSCFQIFCGVFFYVLFQFAFVLQ